jgi:hypothetical protein
LRPTCSTFAATFAALLVGARALRRDSVGSLTAALLVSFWAVSIREQAIVAPVAILAYGWLTRQSRRRLRAGNLFLAAVVGAALVAGFEVWRWGLPLGQDPAPTAGLIRFSGGLFSWGARTYFTLIPKSRGWKSLLLERLSTSTRRRRLVGQGEQPAVSPDGRLLAYATGEGRSPGIVIRDVASGAERSIRLARLLETQNRHAQRLTRLAG